MKFETYVHKIILDYQLNFHKVPCKDARARGVNARARTSSHMIIIEHDNLIMIEHDSLMIVDYDSLIMI